MEFRNAFVLLLVLAVCSSICQSQSTYRFTENSYKAYEDPEVVRVVVERTGNPTASGTVRVSTVTANANSGADYVSVNRVLNFDVGTSRLTVDITIVDDTIDNEDETFIVKLTDATGGSTLGNPSEVVVTIVDGAAPSTGLAQEVLIAIIVASVAAVLILLVCCALIYCLRIQDTTKDDAVYLRRPRPDPLPEAYLPEPREPQIIIPPSFRPHTPPPQARPRTPTPETRRPHTPPPEFQKLHKPLPESWHAEQPADTQVMVINEPSEPIVEPPPRKPTQVIVIRPQTPEVIRARPRPEGQTEVIVTRPKHRSRDPGRYTDDFDRDPSFIGDRPPSPITIVRRVIRKPVPRSPFDHPGAEFDNLSQGDIGFNTGFGGPGGFNGGFGGRDALLNLPPGQGLYGPTNPAFLGQGPSPFGPHQNPFGAQLPPALPPPNAGFGLGFRPPQPRPGVFGPGF